MSLGVRVRGELHLSKHVWTPGAESLLSGVMRIGITCTGQVIKAKGPSSNYVRTQEEREGVLKPLIHFHCIYYVKGTGGEGVGSK